MSRGGPYSKRHRTWPYRHHGGGRGRKSHHGFPRPVFSGQGEAPSRAHLLARRALKDANRAQTEARRSQAQQAAAAARQNALASWIRSGGLTTRELNRVRNLHTIPPWMVITEGVYHAEEVREYNPHTGYYEWNTKRTKTGTRVVLPGGLSEHYPTGLIPAVDITALQAQGVL